MSKALLHFLNRELSRGWHAWHMMWEVLKAKRDSMRKSLGHLLHRGISRGWGAWHEMAVERATFMQKLAARPQPHDEPQAVCGSCWVA